MGYRASGFMQTSSVERPEENPEPAAKKQRIAEQEPAPLGKHPNYT
jgi:hypothetical protein